MRSIAILLALSGPAHGWEFTPGQPCLLTHETDQALIELTYDPTEPRYSITLTRRDAWPDAPAFHMRFDGPQGRMIGTDRHHLSPERRALSVTDTGFGNLLDGLQYNVTAYAIAGDTVLVIPLDGAAAPVAAFRACDGSPPVS